MWDWGRAAQLVWDAVGDDVVHTRATCLGEALVEQRGGIRAVREDELVHGFVDRVGRAPGLVIFCVSRWTARYLSFSRSGQLRRRHQ